VSRRREVPPLAALPQVHCEFDPMTTKGVKYQWWECRHCGRQTRTGWHVESRESFGHCYARVEQLRIDHRNLQQQLQASGDTQ
jgi:hypothetical protein